MDASCFAKGQACPGTLGDATRQVMHKQAHRCCQSDFQQGMNLYGFHLQAVFSYLTLLHRTEVQLCLGSSGLFYVEFVYIGE